MGFKDFIEKAKAKQEERSYMNKDKMAMSKGFSDYRTYELQTAIARKEGYEEARTKLRKDEIKKVKQEEYKDALDVRPKYVKKFERGVQGFKKGMGEFNSVMDELQSISGNKRGNSNQAYASGYGPYKPRKQKEPTLSDMFGMGPHYGPTRSKRRKHKPKKPKHRKKAKSKKSNDVYSWARNY